MIEYASYKDIDKLATMWQAIFGDDRDYIDCFFNNVFEEKNTLVWKDGAHIAAMLHMIPCFARCNGQLVPVVYMYALATEPAYRGKGIMNRLVQESASIGRDRGYMYSFLIPAGKSLFDYYRNLGYESAFYKKILTITRGNLNTEVNNRAAKDISISNLKWKVPQNSDIIRAYCESELCGSNSIVMTDKQYSFILSAMMAEGVIVHTLESEGKYCGYIVYKVENTHNKEGESENVLHIFQLNIENTKIVSLMNQLLKEYEFCRIKLEQVCESVYDMMMCAGAAAEISPYAMKLNLLSNYTDNYQEENVYKQDIGGEEYNQSEFRGLILL